MCVDQSFLYAYFCNKKKVLIPGEFCCNVISLLHVLQFFVWMRIETNIICIFFFHYKKIQYLPVVSKCSISSLKYWNGTNWRPPQRRLNIRHSKTIWFPTFLYHSHVVRNHNRKNSHCLLYFITCGPLIEMKQVCLLRLVLN